MRGNKQQQQQQQQGPSQEKDIISQWIHQKTNKSLMFTYFILFISPFCYIGQESTPDTTNNVTKTNNVTIVTLFGGGPREM